MSCSSCATQFGMFTKEHGCGNCGFSFCSRCLPEKVSLPKLGGRKCSVCKSCAKQITSLASRQQPPVEIERKLTSLEDPSKHPITVYKKDFVPPMLSPEDQKIADRLAKLKESRRPKRIPTEDEMSERLARLKGLNPEVYKTQTGPSHHPPDNRTSAEQTNDLLFQLQDEVSLQNKFTSPEVEITERLGKLQTGNTAEEPVSNRHPGVMTGQNIHSEEVNMDEDNQFLSNLAEKSKTEANKALSNLDKDQEIQKYLQELQDARHADTKGANLLDSDSDNEAVGDNVHKFVSQVLEEEALEKKSEAAGFAGIISQSGKEKAHSSLDDESGKTLPWCVICNEDANLKCYGCLGDLYCRRCFQECHDEFEVKDHRSSPYRHESAIK